MAHCAMQILPTFRHEQRTVPAQHRKLAIYNINSYALYPQGAPGRGKSIHASQRFLLL